ncbi:hypothetical protein QE177_15015 (plasmid) [Arsenophonus sp. aPb]|uniref:hypothetical protein n=1 Tax=Arsenophonus sp. aPb TaxID=3041619 RepID=UPI0024686C0E|nr:hypothetical protein [Arsenophonus sp. aPb]WGL99768.1 hypothetical protein QE177_14695 [Arsenophonus sp. aPb]WGL99887.1 hypothetical protein QE177_15015 [Arsenophonus sp. aPb]
MSNKTFKSQYSSLFERVCIFLGNGWRIDKLEQNCAHRLKLTSANYRHYAIFARLENNRIILTGSIDYYYYRYAKSSQCTVSPMRSATAIAKDINRKILITAINEIKKANDYHQEKQQDDEHRQIVKGMLRRLVKLTPCWNTMTGFNTSNGIDGTIRESYKGYGVQFNGLTTEQLIKLIGFVSVL